MYMEELACHAMNAHPFEDHKTYARAWEELVREYELFELEEKRMKLRIRRIELDLEALGDGSVWKGWSIAVLVLLVVCLLLLPALFI